MVSLKERSRISVISSFHTDRELWVDVESSSATKHITSGRMGDFGFRSLCVWQYLKTALPPVELGVDRARHLLSGDGVRLPPATDYWSSNTKPRCIWVFHIGLLRLGRRASGKEHLVAEHLR